MKRCVTVVSISCSRRFKDRYIFNDKLHRNLDWFCSKRNQGQLFWVMNGMVMTDKGIWIRFKGNFFDDLKFLY